MKEDSFDGIDTLPDEYKTVVLETLETGNVLEPPRPEVPVAKPKKAKKEKKKEEEEEEIGDDDSGNDGPRPKPKRKSKTVSKNKAEDGGDSDSTSENQPKPKRKGKKRPSEELDNISEPEYVPRKTRSRAGPIEEVVDPAVARIQAMADGLRTEAAK